MVTAGVSSNAGDDYGARWEPVLAGPCRADRVVIRRPVRLSAADGSLHRREALRVLPNHFPGHRFKPLAQLFGRPPAADRLKLPPSCVRCW